MRELEMYPQDTTVLQVLGAFLSNMFRPLMQMSRPVSGKSWNIVVVKPPIKDFPLSFAM